MSLVFLVKDGYNKLTDGNNGNNRKNPNNDDGFRNMSGGTGGGGFPLTTFIVQVFNTILLIYALYLSFKCNKGFKFGSVLFACCCPVLYIPYRLAVPC